MPKNDPARLDGSRTAHRADRPQRVPVKGEFSRRYCFMPATRSAGFFSHTHSGNHKKIVCCPLCWVLYVFLDRMTAAPRACSSITQPIASWTERRALPVEFPAGAPKAANPCRNVFLFTPDLRERADVSPKHGFPRFPFFLPPNPIIQLVLPLDNGIGLAHPVIDDDGT